MKYGRPKIKNKNIQVTENTEWMVIISDYPVTF
jgi:hypothetical protein